MAKIIDQYVLCNNVGTPLIIYDTLASAKTDLLCKDLLWTEENPIKTVGRKIGDSYEVIIIWKTPHTNK